MKIVGVDMPPPLPNRIYPLMLEQLFDIGNHWDATCHLPGATNMRIIGLICAEWPTDNSHPPMLSTADLLAENPSASIVNQISP